MKTNKAFFTLVTITSIICLCIGCFFAFSMPVYKTLDKPTTKEGQQKANELIMALEQYKNDTGSYPSELGSLVPDYLSAIPQPTWSAHYSYELQPNEDEFIISFDVGISFDGDYCEYNSRTKNWHCSDKI